MRQRRIHYGVDTDTGFAVSQVFSEGFAIPVLDFESMKPENDFKTVYDLTKFEALHSQERIVWTVQRKVEKSTFNRLQQGPYAPVLKESLPFLG